MNLNEGNLSWCVCVSDEGSLSALARNHHVCTYMYDTLHTTSHTTSHTKPLTTSATTSPTISRISSRTASYTAVQATSRQPRTPPRAASHSPPLASHTAPGQALTLRFATTPQVVRAL